MNWHELLDEAAISDLLPTEYAHFSKPVRDGLAVFLEALPVGRQTELLARQASLGPSASFEARLGLLAQSSPVLQKIGQVLARDHRLPSALRTHLQELESLKPTVPTHQLRETLVREIGPLEQQGISLAPAALAEASVAVVIPFSIKTRQENGRHGVFKILKPGIEEQLVGDLDILDVVGAYLDERCDELKIPHLDYRDVFIQVREKLTNEIDLQEEQRHLASAAKFYARDDRIQIPELFEFCSSRVTAMQRIWGGKITDCRGIDAVTERRLAELVIDALIAQPVFAKNDRVLFHCDPHAGNLFFTTEGRFSILDWSLVGWLDETTRVSLVQIVLSAISQNVQQMMAQICRLANTDGVDQTKLAVISSNWMAKLRRAHFPGLAWLTGLLDEAVQEARLRLSSDLVMFRKSLYTLEGVVRDLGATRQSFDKVLGLKFLESFAAEWPTRWLAAPDSRAFRTRISNLDLAQAVLSLPATATRIWAEESLCLLQASSLKITNSS